MQSLVGASILDQLAKNWWMLAVRGGIGIAFGVLAILMRGLTLAALILLFGAYAFVDGIFATVSGLRSSANHSRDWALVIVGVAGIVAGIVAFLSPALTALALLFVIGGWAIVRGFFELISAWRLREQSRGVWALGLSGLLSVAFGVFVDLFPGAGALAIVFWVGAWSIVTGIALLFLAFRLRSMYKAQSGSRFPGTMSPAR